MDKANSMLRRSGVRLRTSLGSGSGHTDLALAISQLRELKAASRTFAQAQNAALQDLVKWSIKDDNKAEQDAVCQVGELFQVLYQA